MGIAFKDLKQGRYYKGTLDNGSKVFLFVESVVPAGIVNIGVTACRYERKAAGAQWKAESTTVSPGDDSSMRREVSRAEVVAEGVPRCPKDTSAPPSATPKPPATTSSGTKAVLSKPPALRKDGSPKEKIPENATSTSCLHCKMPTKTMTLFQFSAQWCPNCEP